MYHQRQLSHPPVSAALCRPPQQQPAASNQQQQLQQPPVGATNGDISRVYIGGLDRRATHCDLAVFCQQVGQVRGCRVAYDHATNASKCYGYADYATPLDALRAVAYLNGALLFQRPCRVTPVLRDTSSRKGAVREAVAGITESPAQLAALDRAARDEKLRAAVASRIMAHHRDHAESLSRAFVAALGHEPASLLALLAYPTLLEAWVWEALGVSGPCQAASPHQQQHPTPGASARGKTITPAPSAPRAPEVHPLTPPLAPTAGTGATEDAEALELRLDAMVRTFSEDDGTSNARDGSSSSGAAQRSSTSPDSCGSGGPVVEAPLCAAGDAPAADGALATEAALRGALQQYPFLIRVAGQGRPQLPPPPVWRGGPPTASAASATLSLSGHHHAFATPIMSPATMSPYVSATSTPSGLAAATTAATSGAAVSTGSGPMLPPGGAAHVSPLLFGAIPPHTYHQHQQQQHRNQHSSGGPIMMPPSPMNLTGFAPHQQQHNQHNYHHQQSGGGHHASGSPTQQHQQQQRSFVVAGGPQFPAATPHDVASIFGPPSRGAWAVAPGSADRALMSGGAAGVWSPTAATAAAAVAAMAAFASAGGMEVGSPTFGGHHLPPPPPPPLPSAMFGFFNSPTQHPGGGVVAGPFNVVLGQPALQGDPTRSLPVMLPGLAANAVPPSFPPPGLHRQQRLARQQQQQQQRQIAALVAVAAGGGGSGGALGDAAGLPGTANGNTHQPQRRRGGGGGGGAPGGHYRCLSDQAALGNGALLPDLANTNPQECGAGNDGPLRRLCATSTDSGAALDLLLLQAAASEANGSASATAVNTLSSCGSVSTAVQPQLTSAAASAAASLQW